MKTAASLNTQLLRMLAVRISLYRSRFGFALLIIRMRETWGYTYAARRLPRDAQIRCSVWLPENERASLKGVPDAAATAGWGRESDLRLNVSPAHTPRFFSHARCSG